MASRPWTQYLHRGTFYQKKGDNDIRENGDLSFEFDPMFRKGQMQIFNQQNEGDYSIQRASALAGDLVIVIVVIIIVIIVAIPSFTSASP